MACLRERDRRQRLLDGGPVWLQPGGKPKPGSELRRRLVGSETRPVGGDFEKDAAGLAEVDRAEVLAVLHGSRANVLIDELTAHVILRGVISGTEGHVVHRPDPAGAA